MSVELSIRGETKKPEKRKLKLFLEKKGDSIFLRADEEKSVSPWFVFEIKPNGTFSRCGALPNIIGLDVDCDGKIIEEIN